MFKQKICSTKVKSFLKLCAFYLPKINLHFIKNASTRRLKLVHFFKYPSRLLFQYNSYYFINTIPWGLGGIPPSSRGIVGKNRSSRNIHSYLSYDSTTKYKIILVSSTRRVILIFMYLPWYLISYSSLGKLLMFLTNNSCNGNFIRRRVHVNCI